MKYELVTLHVNDLERSLEFYHEIAGLEIQQYVDAGPMTLVFLGKEGEPCIELIYSSNETNHKYSGFSIGFEVESMDDAVVLMNEKGFDTTSEPMPVNPRTTIAFFKGPNGEDIELIENKQV